MKVSTRGRYGLRALVDMAIHSGDAPISLVQVANRQKISLNYLEQVFGTLRKAGIVSSIKGAGGGYKLARAAEEITVREVLEALEGEFSIIDRVAGESGMRYRKQLKNWCGVGSIPQSTCFWNRRL